jgi:hypothetical protein
MFNFFMPAAVGAGLSLLSGDNPLKAVKKGVTSGATGSLLGGATSFTPAANGLNPAQAMMTPTMPEIGGANLYSSGVAPAIPDASKAMPLMTSTAPKDGGLGIMPGEWDWMKQGKGMFDPAAMSLLGGQQQPQQQMPTSSAGMKQANAPSSDEIAKLLASIKIPEREKLLNLFWS